MQVIKRLLYISCLFAPSLGFSQSTLLPQGYKHQALMDRLEIRFRDSAMSFQGFKPFDRKSWVGVLERLDSTAYFSKVDAHNIQSALLNNAEWVTGSTEGFNSKKPVWNTFYKSKADFLQVNVKDFSALTPFFSSSWGKSREPMKKSFRIPKAPGYVDSLPKR
jgi:hypothetical protein